MDTPDNKSFGEAVHEMATGAPDLVKETETRFVQARRYAAEKVEQLRRAAAGKADYMRQRATEGWDVTRDKAKDLHKAGEEYVRANPTKATLITLATGLVLGMIIGSSSRR